MQFDNSFFNKAVPFLRKQCVACLVTFSRLGFFCERWFIWLKEYLINHKVEVLKAFIPLAIIGIGAFSCSHAQRIVKTNIKEIFAISDEIRSYYADKPDYWGLSSETVLKNNMLSAKFISKDKIVLSGGREVFIGNGAKADAVSPGSKSFEIVMPKLSKAQCISFVESKISDTDSVKLLWLGISNGRGDFIFEWGDDRHPLPMQKYASKDFCADNNNTLIWSVK